MQNREVPLGSLPIFFSSLRLAEAGRTCPEVRGGETGRGTRATVRGTQKTEPRARARGAGRGARETGARARAQALGAGPGVGGAGGGARGAGAEHGRRGRGAQDAKRGTRGRGRGRGHGHGGTGCRTQDAGRRTQNTGYRPRAAEHGKRGHEVQKTEDAGTGCRTQNTGYWPRAAEHGKRGHGAQETGHRRRGTSPRAWTAARLHTPARPRNNPPGPSTAGRLPPRAAATCRAYESESRRCRRARRTCCCRAAPRPT